MSNMNIEHIVNKYWDFRHGKGTFTDFMNEFCDMCEHTNDPYGEKDNKHVEIDFENGNNVINIIEDNHLDDNGIEELVDSEEVEVKKEEHNFQED